MTVSCPSCGAPVAFRGTLTLVAVCGHCQTILSRTDVDVKAIGKTASVPYDVSPLQIGSTGTHNGRQFDVVGRLKRGWDDGFWNEWYLMDSLGDGTWLAEAQGLWLWMHELPLEGPPPAAANWQVGKRYNFEKLAPAAGHTDLKLVDVKKAQILAAEGQLPFTFQLGSQSICMDYNGPAGACATLEYPSDSKPHFFLGQYVDALSLNLKNLRTLDGWRF